MNSVSPVDLDALVNFFESITPDTVAQLGHFYDSQARFVDPFNDVQGLAAIEHILPTCLWPCTRRVLL